VWNEPNIGRFWAGTQNDYFKLYEFTVKAIKNVDASIKVGGSITAMNA
jgi:xylan 1,4-beta-xylosidase